MQARAGNAGLIATVAIAFAGVLVGALSAYLGERGATATARSVPVAAPSDTAISKNEVERRARDRIIARIVAGEAPLERLVPPSDLRISAVPRALAQPSPARGPVLPPVRPKVIIIIDDMGVDRRASEKALTLPGPLTYSFLPYAHRVDQLVEKAREAGAEIMLHLPMEPRGKADPGPHALRAGMTGGEFLKDLEWNLTRFDGYVGVNNHMGSKLTADSAAMKTLLSYLNLKRVFFLDSVTTSKSMVRKAAREIGVTVYARDVFLDDQAGNEAEVRTQLALAERIARETGYVVAIGHPHKETLDVLGPWLTTAPARGFDLVVASALTMKQKPEPTIMAAAPGLRF